MCPIYIGLHLLRTKERIVDEWINTRGVMDVQHRRPSLADILQKVITVVIPLPPLLVCVDSTEGGHRYIEVIMEILSLFNLSFTGICIYERTTISAGYINSSFPTVAPGSRHDQWLLVVEVRVERALILIVIKA